jgi:hypothetical protein
MKFEKQIETFIINIGNYLEIGKTKVPVLPLGVAGSVFLFSLLPKLIFPCTMLYLAEQRKGFEEFSDGSETLGMTSEGLGEMFKGEFATMCVGVDGGLSGGQACADLGERTKN